MSLIEAAIGLLVLGLVTAAAVPYAIGLQQQAADDQSAHQLTLVAEGADSYVKANFAALEAAIVSAAGQAQEIPIAQLTAGTYLPSGFQDQNGFGQSHRIVVRRTAPGVLETTVFTLGGTTPSDVRAAGIANRVPGGAFVSSANPTLLVGPGFQLAVANFASAPVQPKAGSISATLYFRGDTVLTDYIYRNPVPGYPQAQQLGPGSTLDLNNQPVINAGTIAPVQGSPVTIAGDFNVAGASSFIGPVVVNNTLRATGGGQFGNLSVGLLSPDSLSAAAGHSITLEADSSQAIINAIGGTQVATISAGNLALQGNMQISGSVDFGADQWHTSAGFGRLFFSGSGETLFGGNAWTFQNSGADAAQITGNGDYRILGSGNIIIPANTSQGVTNSTGTAWLHLTDPTNNTQLANLSGGGIYLDSAALHARDPAGNEWLAINGAGANFSVPVTIANDLSVNGNAMIAGTLIAGSIVTSSETINGDLAVIGSTQLSGALTVGGPAHFHGGIDNDLGTLTLGAGNNLVTASTKLLVQGGRGIAEWSGTDATLAITGDAVRLPSISWHHATGAEGLMSLTQTGWQRIEFTDQQGQGLGIYATGRIHTTGNLTTDGNLQLTGNGNVILPAGTSQGLVTSTGMAWLHLTDASNNLQIANETGGGIYLDSASLHARDAAGNEWLQLSGSGAVLNVPVTVNAAFYARSGVWNDVGPLILGQSAQPTVIAGSSIALNGNANVALGLTVTGSVAIGGATTLSGPTTINSNLTVNGNETVSGQAQATNYVIPDSGYSGGESCGLGNNGKTRWNPTLYGNLGGMERCLGGAAVWRPFSEYKWSDWSACINNSQSRQCIKLGQNVAVNDARYCGGANANDFTQACVSCVPQTGQSCTLAEIIDGVTVLQENDGVHNFCADTANGYQYGTPVYNGFWSVCEWTGTTQCNGACVPGGCSNGAINYPTCNMCFAGLIFNGAGCVSPSCAPNYGAQCANDAGYGAGYVSCGGQCNCPASTTYQIVNGVPECYPSNQCANGATDPPACDNTGTCSNGATNPPTCNACPSGQVYQNGTCVVQSTCTPNWQVTVPGGGPLYRGYISAADQPDSCGAEAYMLDFNANNGSRAITAAQAIAQGMLDPSWCSVGAVQYYYCWDLTCTDQGVFISNFCAASGPFAVQYTVSYQVNWDIQADGCGNVRYGPSVSTVQNGGGSAPNCCYSDNINLTPPEPACHSN